MYFYSSAAQPRSATALVATYMHSRGSGQLSHLQYVNGREIKNLVKGAVLLAREDDTRVTIGHIRTLADMRLMAKQILAA